MILGRASHEKQSSKETTSLLEPGILEGETRDETIVRLIKVLESKGIRITNKKQEASDKNVE